MPYIERTNDEIISAWEQWLKGVRNPDRKNFSIPEFFNFHSISPREFVEEIKIGKDGGMFLGLNCVREIAQATDLDPIQVVENLKEHH